MYSVLCTLPLICDCVGALNPPEANIRTATGRQSTLCSSPNERMTASGTSPRVQEGFFCRSSQSQCCDSRPRSAFSGVLELLRLSALPLGSSCAYADFSSCLCILSLHFVSAFCLFCTSVFLPLIFLVLFFSLFCSLWRGVVVCRLCVEWIVCITKKVKDNALTRSGIKISQKYSGVSKVPVRQPLSDAKAISLSALAALFTLFQRIRTYIHTRPYPHADGVHTKIPLFLFAGVIPPFDTSRTPQYHHA